MARSSFIAASLLPLAAGFVPGVAPGGAARTATSRGLHAVMVPKKEGGLFSVPEMPSFTVPDLPPLPSLPVPDALPFFGKAAAEPEPVAAIAPPPAPAAAAEPDLIDQIFATAVAMAETLGELLLARLQLVALEAARSVQSYFDTLAADAAALPVNAAATAQRAVYKAPFYAKAAVQLAAEGVVSRFERGVSKVQSAVSSAPYYAKAAVLLTVEGAQAKTAAAKAEARRAIADAPASAKAKLQRTADETSLALLEARAAARVQAEETIESAVSAPEDFINSFAARVKAELDGAKASAGAAVGGAKSSLSRQKGQ